MNGKAILTREGVQGKQRFNKESSKKRERERERTWRGPMEDARPMERTHQYDVHRKREQEEEQNGRERERRRSRSRSASSLSDMQVHGEHQKTASKPQRTEVTF